MKVWDLHCDTLYELRRAEKAGAPKSFLHNDLHIDLEKLQQGDYLLQCFAAYVDLADPAPGADPLVSVLEEIEHGEKRCRIGRHRVDLGKLAADYAKAVDALSS